MIGLRTVVFPAVAFFMGGVTETAFAQAPSGVSATDARKVVERMLDGMGGAEKLKSIRAIRVKTSGYEHHLEQSERPEGPWIVSYAQTTETRDFEKGRMRHEEETRSFFYQSARWVPANWMYDSGVAATLGPGGRTAPRDAFTAQRAEEALELGPERIGLTALAAQDLHLERDVTFRGHAHAVAAFHWKSYPVRVLISRESGLLSAVELTRPRIESVFWGPWGDVTFRTSFALWMLERGGVRLPRTTFTEWDGFPVSSRTTDEIEFDPATADADFAITDEVRQAFQARKMPADEMPLGGRGLTPLEPAPGITQIRGAWDVTLVKQSDGVVILEGPISNGYSARVLEEAAKRYPGVPVKAVITTSDAWPHIGGMREYVARGIPILALDHNRAILNRLVSAPRKIVPDALAHAPKAPRFTFVSKRILFGSGENRMELIPLRTVTGERQMAIWFPEPKLLYSSDLFQRDQTGDFFLPQTLSEIVTVAAREGLEPKTLFAMHLPPTPWTDITAAHARHVAPAVPARPNE